MAGHTPWRELRDGTIARRRARFTLAIISGMADLGAYVLIWRFDWRIAAGMFLLQFASNLSERLDA